MRFLVVLAAIAATTLMSSAAADAANRFASPGGGTTEPCLESDPCVIATAVTGDPGGRPHDVTLTGGVPPATGYTISSSVNIPAGVTVHGAPGARPRIQGTFFGNGAVIVSASAVLRDVSIDHADPNNAGVFTNGGTLERVHARSAGGGCIANPDSVVRDSVCWTPDGGFRAGFTAQGPFSGTVTLRNVTAVGTGGTTPGLGALAFSTGATLDVVATNVIAHSAGGADVTGSGLGCCTGQIINISLDHSNYDSELENSDANATVTITDPGDLAGQNQITPPVFTDTAAGDFTQTAASTGTVNLGVDGGLGAFDLNGLDRFQGPAPDIGAHEFPEADPPVPPTTNPPVVSNPPVLTPPVQDARPKAKKCKKGKKLKKGKCTKKKRKKGKR